MDNLNCEGTVTVLPIQGVEATRSLMIKACDDQLAKSTEHLADLDKRRKVFQEMLADLDKQEWAERERIRKVLGVQARWKLVIGD